jgi:hypothetical protein
VSILLGNGDGTFQTHRDVAVGVAPTGLVTSDFNRDGILDLAVTRQYSEKISILLGKGNGQFQAPVDYPAGSFPGSPITADFNADGYLDLAATDSDNAIWVLLGNGDGTFKPQVTYPTGDAPTGLRTVDMNADGILDIVNSDSASETISVFLGNGDGTFKPRMHYRGIAGGGPGNSISGDFNADGSLDLAFTYVFGDAVSVFLQTQPVNQNCLERPAGLVSWWSGDKTADDVQGTNPGVLKNGASFAKGMVGAAFRLDGVDDYVQILNNASLNPGTSDFTFEFWINTTQVTDFAYIFEKRPICALSSFYNVQFKDGGIAAELGQDTTTTNYNVVISLVPINDGAWHHVALVREGVTATIYTDGVATASASTQGVTSISNDRPLTIGRGLCHREFGGMVDELTYYRSALSASDIAAIYTAGSAGKCKPEIFVAAITPSYEVVGHGFLISTSIVIQDENGLAIGDASAQVKTTLPSGSVLAFPVKTDATGEATLSFNSRDSGRYEFTVVKVRHPVRDYNPALNIERSDTLTIP